MEVFFEQFFRYGLPSSSFVSCLKENLLLKKSTFTILYLDSL
jgi:hypothetical protein